jgi:glutamyl-tRNA synthetase
MSERVRFAPSPSGYLHVGGARTAIFNWLWARQQGGTFIVRVEDTDQERSSLDSVQAVLDAMRWLGLDWDEGPEVGGPHAPYFQSERRSLFVRHAEELIAAGKAYRCTCSKEDLDRQRALALEKNPKEPFRYPGTCRDKNHSAALPHVVRFKVPNTGATVFDDVVFGQISTPNDVQYDFVLLRADGYPVYNWSCVVDDHLMGITLVARGRDHLGNTPQQVMLYQALGWDLPRFAHLPLMLDKKGAKLSKRAASVAVQDYRDKGYTPAAVLNYLVRFGWSLGDQEIFTREQLIESFSWDRVGRADGRFDELKFADVAFEHLKEPSLLSLESYTERLLPFLAARGLAEPPKAELGAAIETIRPRAKTLVDAASAVDFYFREPPEFEAPAVQKHLVPASAPILHGLIEQLSAVPTWELHALEERVKAWSDQAELKMKDIAQPARVALTGKAASPGLFEVMVVLGRERSLARLQHGAALASAGSPARV